jgi:hypothetical protein
MPRPCRERKREAPSQGGDGRADRGDA